MKVVEIFQSIDGEGTRAGYPTTFVRLQGCNLKCSYCDSQYACVPDDSVEVRELSPTQVAAEVADIGIPRVTITGGEPLMHKGVIQLIRELCHRGFDVNVETNGSIQPPIRHANVFYTVDYKTLSSGMSDKMDKYIFTNLGPRDVLKFVVGTKSDLDQARDVLRSFGLLNNEHAQIFFSPVFGKIEAKEIVQYLLDKEMYNCRVQLQLHKYIWDKDMRGV